MAIAIEELSEGITKVILDGKLDIEGAAAVDLKMNVIAGSCRTVLIDLQNVTFLGSMGLRMLLGPARTIKSRGGKIVLFGPSEAVDKALKTAGIEAFIPIYYELHAALTALQ